MKYLFLLLALVSSACTVEQSKEERTREDVDRAAERLKYAVGNYGGELQNAADTVTPMRVDVELKKNYTGTGQKPELAVSLEIGLFGGVILSSTSTAYDWGTGELIASFSRNGLTDSSGFELRGHLVDGQMADGKLVGAHLGLRTFTMKRGDAVPFDNNPTYAYDVKWQSPADKADVPAILKIKTTPSTQVAPGTSDLAYLPGLEGSLEFNAFGSAPQNATATYYDPTTGTLDLQFTSYSWLHVTGVGLSPGTQQKRSPAGNLALGGASIRQLTLDPLAEIPAQAMFPPATYSGYYQGSSASQAFKAVAYLNFLGGTAANSLDLPFLSYPKMRMELDICNNGGVFNQVVLQLKVMDYLGHKAIFHRMMTEQDPLEVTFSNAWNRLDGVFLQVDQHEGGQQPRVVLVPNPGVAQYGCAG